MARTLLATIKAKPDTVEAISGSAAAPSITFQGDTNTGIFRSGADQIDIATGGVSRFRVEPSGVLRSVVTSSAGPSFSTTLLPGYMARAWVNFNGQGAPTIRAAGNVTSITDLGVGQYRINFAVAMPDANYAVVANHIDTINATIRRISHGTDAATRGTSSFDIITAFDGGDSYDLRDPDFIDIVVFR